MSEFIIVDGDRLDFSPTFGANTVTPTGTAQINGTGKAAIANKSICIVGDEKNVSVSATYTSAAYPTSGMGTLKIATLAADQRVDFATAETAVIVVGSKFNALFTVSTPASHPTNGADPQTEVPGTGTFINSQQFVTAG